MLFLVFPARCELDEICKEFRLIFTDVVANHCFVTCLLEFFYISAFIAEFAVLETVTTVFI